MSAPHVCPVCKGVGERLILGVRVLDDPCPACKGACVLWGPENSADEVRRAGDWLWNAIKEQHRARFGGSGKPDVCPTHEHDVSTCSECRRLSFGTAENRIKAERRGRQAMMREVLSTLRLAQSADPTGPVTRIIPILADVYRPRFEAMGLEWKE